MLATLYDLEIVEEKGVRDWLSPPDNRHLFLKEAKGDFTTKENVEAKKQVCVDAELATEFVMRGRVVLVLALPMPYMLGLDILLSPALLMSLLLSQSFLCASVRVPFVCYLTSLTLMSCLRPCWFQAAL